MTITREQQAQLYRGDTLELKFNQDGAALTLRGTFPEITNFYDNYLGGPYTLTVVSRAPRPLYTNSDRTEPVDHDVVRDGDGAIRHCDAKGFGGKPTWWSFEAIAGCKWTHTTFPPQPLTLLVDGETGRCVP